MSVEWVNHKGMKILVFNCKGLKEDTMKPESDILLAMVVKEPERSVLILTDVRDTVVNTEMVQIFKEYGDMMKKYFRKQAVIGVTGIRQILLNAVTRFTGQAQVFDDIEKAKDWLVSG